MDTPDFSDLPPDPEFDNDDETTPPDNPPNVDGAAGGGNSFPPRDGDGQFRQVLDNAIRDAKACRMKERGLTYQEIADEMGYADRSGAFRAVKRALRSVQVEAATDLRKIMLAQMDDQFKVAFDIANRKHPLVAGKDAKIVFRSVVTPVLGPDGLPSIDDRGNAVTTTERVMVDDPRPVLAALAEMRQIMVRKSKLLGLDAPSKSRVEVITIDQLDAEMARLAAEVEQLESQQRADAQ